MGTYTVWIATGETEPGPALIQAMIMSETYDETENDRIPENWPGLSFDYAEPVLTSPATGSLHELKAGRPPGAMITEYGQIRAERPEWATDDRNFIALSYGVENIAAYLRQYPNQLIVVAKWHC